MSAKPVFNEPSKAIAIDGEVVVEGPDGVGHSFTPGAARETGRRLVDAANEAARQVVPDADKGAAS